MKIFDHDDEGYIAWLKNNPAGYVLNLKKRPYTLHRATCILVNNKKPNRGLGWTGLYKKMCATDRASIEKYRGLKLRCCQKCLPESASALRSKSPRSSEDWIRKGDHVFVFVRNTVKLYRADGNGGRIEITDLDEVAHILCWGHPILKRNAKRILKSQFS